MKFGDKTTDIQSKLDAGSQINVLSHCMIKYLNVNLIKTDTIIIAYGNFKIKPTHKVIHESISNDVIIPIKIFIIEKKIKTNIGFKCMCKIEFNTKSKSN